MIDKLNLNHLRVFEAVYRSRSMTQAAKELHLTQSGVSQHVKTLEGTLELKLFDRINQRLVPTASATLLFEECTNGFQRIEHALWRLSGGEKELSGVVSVGMPNEFGMNVVMPLVASFGKIHPRVQVRFTLDFASVMNDRLLGGDLDFAFVDEYGMDKRITTEGVYDEVVSLCASPAYIEGHQPVRHQRKYYEGLDYIEYQAGEPVLRMWFGHHLDTRALRLRVRAQVMEAQGVARLVLAGLGVGALPGHLLTKLQGEGHPFHIFRGSGKPLKNSISLAYLKDRTQSPAAAALLAHLSREIRKVKKDH
ncbi:MAG TPA: LysR family transcriptional regulator [Bdellovibrionota bacterium]|nr:LysR family transcriptional regulator [Bdellovibrionota bacterium]